MQLVCQHAAPISYIGLTGLDDRLTRLDDRLRHVEVGVASIQAHLTKTIDRNNDPAIP